MTWDEKIEHLRKMQGRLTAKDMFGSASLAPYRYVELHVRASHGDAEEVAASLARAAVVVAGYLTMGVHGDNVFANLAISRPLTAEEIEAYGDRVALHFEVAL